MPKTKKTPGLPKSGKAGQHPTKVWLIFHCEIWQTKPNLFHDEMVFHVASSLEQAEAFIKDIYILGDAWWQVAEFTVNNPDFDKDADSVRYYGNKGRLLKKPPITRASKVFEKENPEGFKT